MDHCQDGKKKLLVVLGAGSSVPYGMPSVECLDGKFLIWSREWEESREEKPAFNPYKSLWGIFREYYRNSNFHGTSYCNFESVLAGLTSLAKWLAPQAHGNPMINEIGIGLVTNKLGLEFCLTNDDKRKELRNLVYSQYKYLVTELANYMRTQCGNNQKGVTDFSRFLEALRSNFEVGIYTLNYDNIATRAWPSAFTGFDDRFDLTEDHPCFNVRLFDPIAVLNRQEWDFIYHLHGSVHYNIKKHPKMKYRTELIEWEDDLNADFKDYKLYYIEPDSNSMGVPFSTHLAGGFKLEQLLPEPYHTFYAALAKHAYEADAFLVIGYGFGDMHVNRALQNRLEVPDWATKNHPGIGRPRPSIAIVDKSDQTVCHTGALQGREFKYWQLTHCLLTRFKNHGDNRPHSEVVSNGLEYGSHRVLLWHLGVEEAYTDANVDRIIRHL